MAENQTPRKLDPAIAALAQALARAAAREDHARAQRLEGWLNRVRALEGRDRFAEAAELAEEIAICDPGSHFRTVAIGCHGACKNALRGIITSRKLYVARNAVRALRLAIEEALPA